MENAKKGVMITYIQPYKNTVNLWEMSDNFGMELSSVESLVSHLIMEGDIKGWIDSYNKIIVLSDDNYQVKSFEKAIQAGEEFLRNIEILLNKHAMEQKFDFSVKF